MKRLLLGLFLLTGCGEPSIIIREETLNMVVTSTEYRMVVRGRSFNSLSLGYNNNPKTTSLNVYSKCTLNKEIMGHEIKVKKSLYDSGMMRYTVDPSVTQDLIMEFCW